jgi:hypothetical protein
MGKTFRFEPESHNSDSEDCRILRAFPGDDLGLEPCMDEEVDYLQDGRGLQRFDKDIKRRRKRLRRLQRMSRSEGDRSAEVQSSPEQVPEDRTEELRLWLAAGMSISAFESHSRRR